MVKNSIQWWFVVAKKWPISSSARIVRAANTLAAAVLRPVQVGLGALRVAAAGDRDDDFLVRHQVLDGQVAVGRDDLGTPLVAELLDDLGQLVADDGPLPDRVGQDVLEVGDDRLELVQPVDDLLPLQGGQPAQLHVQDRLRLDLVDLQQLTSGPVRASSTSGLRRISAMTSSSASSAFT